ncbi:MAG: HEAT-like repeat-containing protein [Nitrospirae bacterium]|nr:HEAT-like repeat-containing protein [Nitrospirota bacterium]
MQEDEKQTEVISPEVQDVMRNFVSAVRAVKLYPPNNPVYSQAIKKAYESFARFLETAPRYTLGVQKTYFLYEQLPVSKDTQLNKTIAQDLFGKGMREFVFQQGLTEEELAGFCAALALSAEEQALKSGIVSILWEMGSTHIKVTEAALQEVITASPEQYREGADDTVIVTKLSPEEAKKEFVLSDRTLVLGDLVDDPGKLGAAMLDTARQTAGENETVEDRLHSLYQEAGRKIQEQHREQSDELFEGLAKSVLAMDPEHRDKFIAAKLYAEMDAEQVREQGEEKGEGQEAGAPGYEGVAGSLVSQSHIPDELHEIVTGRYSRQWTVRQIATLLKRSAAKQPEKPAPAIPPSQVSAVPLTEDLYRIALELSEYTPEEMEALKIISEVGMESDIIEASVRTLIFLLPLVKNPHRTLHPEKELDQFSSLVQQLEDMLTYLLKTKDYALATIIVRSYHLPVDAAFKPRMVEAIKKASSRDVISAVVTDMRMNKKGSPEYLAAYSYLMVLDREATTVLLEILAVEKDRTIRKNLVEILKDLGRKQISIIGRHLSDSRWFVVRNIVNILGDSGSEDALPFLEKVTSHTQIQVRQEVIKGLLNIGGKKAAVLLCRFINDIDSDIQLSAIRGLASIHGAGKSEAQALTEFLEGRPIKKKENELTKEVFKTLEKIGDAETAEFLKRYLKVRWWKARRPQDELRAAAEPAIAEIQRRQGNAGRTG